MKKTLIFLLLLTSYCFVQGQTAADYFKRGNEKFVKNDFLGAEKDFTKAIELNPKFSEAYINRGRIKHNKFDDDRGAITDYTKAIEIDPKNANTYFYRGNAYRNLKEFKKACLDWTKASELGNMDAKSSLSRHCK